MPKLVVDHDEYVLQAQLLNGMLDLLSEIQARLDDAENYGARYPHVQAKLIELQAITEYTLRHAINANIEQEDTSDKS